MLAFYACAQYYPTDTSFLYVPDRQSTLSDGREPINPSTHNFAPYIFRDPTYSASTILNMLKKLSLSLFTSLTAGFAGSPAVRLR